MPRRNLHPKKLQLELLESRVMLAVADAPSPEAVAAVDSAIETSVEILVDLQPSDRWLKISGSGSGNVSIDLTLLPATLETLIVNSFDSVTLVGAGSIEKLSFSDVRFVDAGQITVGESLHAYDVEHIRIDTAPELILLQGRGLDPAEHTLLEVDAFSTSANASIFAWVKTLGIASSAHIERVPEIVSYPNQSILLSFTPDAAVRVADEAHISVQIVQAGDFARYFFATPDQRDALEASPTFSRTLAEVERIPLATLLGNLKLQIAIGEAFDLSDKVQARPDATILAGQALEMAVRLDANLPSTEMTHPVVDISSAKAIPGLSLTGAEFESVSVTAPAEPTTHAEHAESVQLAQVFWSDTRTQSVSNSDSGLSALSAALARWTEPFVETAVNLQGHLASFGAIASAEVNDRMRADSRPPLLVDARSVRQREAEELVVVNV